jgi:hypothetical protein
MVPRSTLDTYSDVCVCVCVCVCVVCVSTYAYKCMCVCAKVQARNHLKGARTHQHPCPHRVHTLTRSPAYQLCGVTKVLHISHKGTPKASRRCHK